MSIQPIQLRRINGLAPESGRISLEGEVGYHDQKGALAIYRITNGGRWHLFPEVHDGNLIMHPDTHLYGRDAAGAENKIVFDWSASDTLLVRHKDTRQIIAAFGVDGTRFNLMNNEISGLANTRNLAINGNFAVTRKVGAQTTYTTVSLQNSAFMFAPNWLVWNRPTSAGTLAVQYDTSDVNTLSGRQPRVLRVTSANLASSAGLRTFFFDYPYVAGQTVTIEFDIKGEFGETTNIRIASEQNTNIYSKQHIANGSWQRVKLQVFLPADASTWWAIDALHNPSGANASTRVWKIGGLQVGRGGAAGLLEQRLAPVEQQLVDTIYREGRIRLKDATMVEAVSLDGILRVPDKVDLFATTQGTPTSSNLDSTGFDVTIPGLPAGPGSTVKYSVYCAPAVTA